MKNEKALEFLRTGIIFLVSFSLLWIFRTIQFSSDSFWYARNIALGEDMFHPHHVLFCPAVNYLLWLFKNLHAPDDVLIVAQLHNIFFASLGVSVFYKIARRILDSQWQSLIGTSIFLFSSGWWNFASQIEVYVPAATFLLLIVWLIFRKDIFELNGWNVFFISVFWALSIGYHQTNILFCIPFMVWVFSSGTRKDKFSAAIILCATGMLTIAMYVWAISKSGTVFNYEGIVGYTLKYAVDKNTDWGVFSNFLPYGWFLMFQSQSGVLFRMFYSRIVFWVILMILIILGVLGFNLWRHFQPDANKDTLQSFRKFLLVWIATYYLFFLWWLPGESEFFIVTLIPLLLLAVLAARELMASPEKYYWAKWMLPLFALLVLIPNLPQMLKATSTPSSAAVQAEALYALSQDGNCMIMCDFSEDQYLLFKHHSRSTRFQSVYRNFVRAENHEVRYPPSQESCFLVHMNYVSPTRVFDGYSGETHPAEWLNLMRYLFDISENEGRIAWRDFEILTSGNDLIMRVSSNKKTADNWLQFWSSLDDWIYSQNKIPSQTYENWDLKNRNLFRK